MSMSEPHVSVMDRIEADKKWVLGLIMTRACLMLENQIRAQAFVPVRLRVLQVVPYIHQQVKDSLNE
jgi:hypothetical protein